MCRCFDFFVVFNSFEVWIFKKKNSTDEFNEFLREDWCGRRTERDKGNKDKGKLSHLHYNNDKTNDSVLKRICLYTKQPSEEIMSAVSLWTGRIMGEVNSSLRTYMFVVLTYWCTFPWYEFPNDFTCGQKTYVKGKLSSDNICPHQYQLKCSRLY